MKHLVALLCLSMLAACGGSGDPEPVVPQAPPAPVVVDHSPNALRIIGNSITFVPAGPEWDHDGGAAASSAATDYAHLVAAGLGMAHPTISNFASLERNPADPVNAVDLTTPMGDLIAAQTVGMTDRTIVVIELGDNAPQGGSPDFTANYGKLLDAVTPNAGLVCVGTFWLDELVDNMILAACTAHHGTYVYIGDIYGDPANRDLIDGPQYANPGINQHPHDWSMSVIARRILKALQS